MLIRGNILSKVFTLVCNKMCKKKMGEEVVLGICKMQQCAKKK